MGESMETKGETADLVIWWFTDLDLIWWFESDLVIWKWFTDLESDLIIFKSLSSFDLLCVLEVSFYMVADFKSK